MVSSWIPATRMPTCNLSMASFSGTGHVLLCASLLLSTFTLAQGQVERFIVKDRISTIRLYTLEGDRLEETVYDQNGMPTSRVLNLDTSLAQDALPTVSTGPTDGTIVEETPTGILRTTYRGGFAVHREVQRLRPAEPATVRDMAERMVGLPVLRSDPISPVIGVSPKGFAYAFCGKLGVFVPWSIQEQAVFGEKVDPNECRPGDLIFLAKNARSVPDRVAIALGPKELVLPDPVIGRVVKKSLSSGLGGRVVGARRVLNTIWERFFADAPPEVLVFASRKETPSPPRWKRIQGLVSFYPHVGSDLDPTNPRLDGTPGEEGLRPSAANHPPDHDHVFALSHRSLPLGTKARVTLPDTGRSVVCTVTDRGAFESDRSFDVCFEAARILGLDEVGVAMAEIEILAPSPSGSSTVSRRR